MLVILPLFDRIFFRKAQVILPNTTVGRKVCGREPDKDSEAELNSFAMFGFKGC